MGYLFCSSLKRAQVTAKYLFQGNIYITELLREVPMKAVFKTNLKLPVLFRFILSRVDWLLTGKYQTEDIRATRQRAEEFLLKKCFSQKNDKNILIVSHGLFMFILQKLLLRKIFKGKRFLRAEHGKIYVYKSKA